MSTRRKKNSVRHRTVQFQLTDLEPDTAYEVQVSTDPHFDPDLTVSTTFRTTRAGHIDMDEQISTVIAAAQPNDS